MFCSQTPILLLSYFSATGWEPTRLPSPNLQASLALAPFFFLHLHLLTHDPALSLTLCKNPLLPLGSGSIPFLLNRLFHFLFSYLSLTLSVTLSPVIHFCLALKLVLESSREETKFSTLPSSDLPVSLTSIFSLLVHFSIHLSVTLFLP